MVAFTTLIDAVLFLFFLVIALVAPLIDSQACLPLNYYPQILVDLKKWYSREYGDYLFEEKPAFFVGLVWLELLFQWPLAVVNLYAIMASKSWFRSTCMIYGVSIFTSMGAIMSEIMMSGKASDKLLMMYFPFVGFAVLAMLRGLLPCSTSATSNAKRTPLPRKKRA